MRTPRLAARGGFFGDLIALPRVVGCVPELALASLTINLLSLALPLVLMQVYDRIVPNRTLETLIWLVIGFCLALGLEAVLRLCRSTITNWAAARFEHAVGYDCLLDVVRSRLDAFGQHGVGEYLERFAALSTLRRFFSGQAVQVALDIPFAVVFILTIAFLGGATVAWYVIAAIAVYLAAVFLLRPFYQKRRIRQRGLGNERFSFVVQALSGIHTLKALTAEEPMARRYERLQTDTSRINFELSLLESLPASLAVLCSQLILFGVILLAGQRVIAGVVTMGGLAACSLLAGRCFQPFASAAALWLQYADIRAAKEQIAAMQNLPSESPASAPPLPPDIRGDLALERVVYGSGHGRVHLLDGVDLTVPARSMAGIFPAEGQESGTLLQVAMGLLRPVSGAVRVDDIDLGTVDVADLRGRMAYVPAAGTLFHGSILDNLSCFNPRYRENALDSAALMGLDSAIAQLPHGYETVVGNRLHEALPTGVVQRIALARALVVRPRILLLDAVDGLMDQESLDVMCWLMGKLKGQCTVLLVTSEPRLLGLCDAVYRFKEGLIEPDPAYATCIPSEIQTGEPHHE